MPYCLGAKRVATLALLTFTALSRGEVLSLLENWRDAAFADVNQQTGFDEPGKGAPHGNENTGFAAHT
ncbi:MAG: hypothetical protein WB408_18455 [Terracidiphilus sp.]